MSNDESEYGKSQKIKSSAAKTRLVRSDSGAVEAASGSGGGGDEAKTRIMRPKSTGSQKTQILRAGKAASPSAPSASASASDDSGGAAARGEGDTGVYENFVTGWLVVIDGPGKGNFAPVYTGMNSIGRGDDQRIQLDFGDVTVSRSDHAFVAYDDETREFFVQHGGKTNLIRLNDRPVLSLQSLNHGDKLRIGKMTLLFVALCGKSFDWSTV